MSCGRPRVVEVNGLPLMTWEWGAAGQPAALLLHSLAAHSHWWDWTAPIIAERFHVVALDFRGHGQSAWAEPAAYRFGDYVADVTAVLDAFGWRAPLVIGHSLGGYVGAYLAARHPARVGALVIADMLTFWTEEMRTRARELAARPGVDVPDIEEAARRFRLTPPDTRAPQDHLGHLAESGVRQREPGAWTPAFDRRVFLHPDLDPWPFLPGVLCPTLVVRGERSPVMDREAWQRVTMAVRRGQFAELRDAYHHLILDDPAGFAGIVTRWLAGAQKEVSP